MQESTVAASDLIDFTGKVELIPRPQRVSVCQGLITTAYSGRLFPVAGLWSVEKSVHFSRPLGEQRTRGGRVLSSSAFLARLALSSAMSSAAWSEALTRRYVVLQQMFPVRPPALTAASGSTYVLPLCIWQYTIFSSRPALYNRCQDRSDINVLDPSSK